MNQNNNILSIKDLSVHYITKETGICKAVNKFSLDIKKGEAIGLVGETGAGKTTVALSILKLLQTPPGKVVSGEIFYKGKDILKMNNSEIRKIRGEEISMIFQDPMTALNPIDSVGKQIAEVIYLHKKVSKREAMKLAADALELVGIPKERMNEYPNQFSGGMKQRVVIATALACSPQLLLADEPTTALDVTIQAQVLDLMNELKKNLNTSLLLITHDLGVVAEMCDRVAIMYAGEIVEIGPVKSIFRNPQHPYTRGLFEALPSNKSNSKRLKQIDGLMPDPTNLPPYCKFEPRCSKGSKGCGAQCPEFIEVSEGHWVRCHLAGEKWG
ncbi:peptide/nickel transport system ATP-binding protein [Ruminiclostridium sufflavum DSM 19573]|uniref:Peptide/nickel transport system ATP-binding protein n=1 Tax=Ruminiclostridium sufflavum DSM 19573 TaxID=1121337 RepID=A0A318XRX9_9FIRM|nr:ABC transporter ATP-binding protein [Ruminiclostridium sufflavum]PYG90264.1 peptide/nickel transport system ATP-binding protein [Ruminiclostridium sufflavum DSM 19573]